MGSFKNSLIEYHSSKILPGIAIYGKNGGGKSNVIRAFWLAVQFIKNAQKTQHENATIPVIPFALNDYSSFQPTEFEFTYVLNDIKYWYSFSATREKVIEESLYYAPKGQKATVFIRKGQAFSFTRDKIKRNLISKAVAENQLFFSVACTMNDEVCVSAMRWFRERIYFSRDYSDIPSQLLEHSGNSKMLQAISDYAKEADFGIEEMQFEIKSKEVGDEKTLPDDMPEEVKFALIQFLHTLSETSNNSEIKLKMGIVTATSKHQGVNQDGKSQMYTLELEDESDGTRKLMSLAPAIESVLKNGGILFVDEIERELHPALVDYIVSKKKKKKVNTFGAQIVFTTHNTELLNLELLRKDQIYFTDKKKKDGASELYSIAEFATRTTDNIRKGYLLGKYGATPNLNIEEVE